MDENNFTPYVPTLTLDPTGAAAAAAQPAAPVAEEKEPEKTELERLSPEEQAAVRQFAEHHLL